MITEGVMEEHLFLILFPHEGSQHRGANDVKPALVLELPSGGCSLRVDKAAFVLDQSQYYGM